MTAPLGDIPVTTTGCAAKGTSPAAGTPRLAVENLRILMTPRRGRPDTNVVDEISFTVQPGQVLGLVGESGSGKTTVGLALLGLVKRGLKLGGGMVLVDGRDILALPEHELQKLRGRTVAYVPQDPASALNPVLKVGTQLREVFTIHGADASRLTEVLAEAGLEDPAPILAAYPHQLSGGQQQRVALTMAFACRPRLIVLDEPTTDLDVTTQRRVLDTVRGLCRSYQVAAVYITHDLAVVAEIADHVAVLYAGRLIEQGQARELFASPAHPYSRGLLRAVPVLEGTYELHGLAGSPPRPGSRPAGCFFQPRCEFAVAECERRQPEHGHRVRDRPCRPVRARGGDQGAFRHRHPSQRPPGALDRGAGAHDQRHVGLLHRQAGAARRRPRGRGPAVGRDRRHLGVGQDHAGPVRGGPAQGLDRHDHVRGRRTPGWRPPPDPGPATPDPVRLADPYSSLNPRQTVGQIVGRPLAHFFKLSGAEHKKRIGDALTSVALRESFAARYPDELSGGERQRVALARALVLDPDLLVCDEITSALDVSVQAAIVELLLRLQVERGLALLFITHNLPLVRSIADDVTVISAGQICEHGPVGRVLTAPSHAYTRQLLADVPAIGTG